MSGGSSLGPLLALVACAAGCGEDAANGQTPPASEITIDNFPELLADAMCEGADACCRSLTYASSPTLCRETVEGLPQVYQWDSFLADGAVFDAEAAHECLELWRQAVQACELSEAVRFVPTGRSFPPCDVLRGTLLVGESCAEGLCAPSPLGEVSCNDADICELLRVGQPGDTCAGAELESAAIVVECNTEALLSCDPATDRCEGPVPAGESCIALSCEAGSFCASTDQCTVLPGLGEACQSSRCAAGAGCDPNCAAGLACDWSSRTCAAPAALGEACVDVDCALDLHCGSNGDPTSTVCAPLKLEGEACHPDDSCGELDCRSGRCAPPRPGFCISTL